MLLPEALDYLRPTAITLQWPDVGRCDNASTLQSTHARAQCLF